MSVTGFIIPLLNFLPRGYGITCIVFFNQLIIILSFTSYNAPVFDTGLFQALPLFVYLILIGLFQTLPLCLGI